MRASKAPKRYLVFSSYVCTQLLVLLATISIRLPAQQATLRIERAAGEDDFNELVSRNVKELFAGMTLNPENQQRAETIVRQTMRAQWTVVGQGLPPSQRRNKRLASWRDSLMTLQIARDNQLASLISDPSTRNVFIVRASEIRRKQILRKSAE